MYLYIIRLILSTAKNVKERESLFLILVRVTYTLPLVQQWNDLFDKRSYRESREATV